jgi:hypothetical protein
VSHELELDLRMPHIHTHSHYEIVCHMVPALVQFQKARQRRQAVCQSISCRMQCQEPELWKPSFVYENIGK